MYGSQVIRAEEGGVLISPNLGEEGVHRERPGGGGGRQAAAWVPGLSELTETWPGAAAGASPGLRFLRGWAGGLTEPFVGRGAWGIRCWGAARSPLKPTSPGALAWPVCSVQ